MPTLGKSVEYAIHSLVYFVDIPRDQTISVHDLARFQQISETYLAKVFTKLKKSGIVRSNIGVKGGFLLAKKPEEITFYDIALAVEGEISFFECKNIRDHCILLDKENLPWGSKDLCTIHQAMLEVEQTIKVSLQQKTLRWLYKTINGKMSPEDAQVTTQWFEKNVFNK